MSMCMHMCVYACSRGQSLPSGVIPQEPSTLGFGFSFSFYLLRCRSECGKCVYMNVCMWVGACMYA